MHVFRLAGSSSLQLRARYQYFFFQYIWTESIRTNNNNILYIIMIMCSIITFTYEHTGNKNDNGLAFETEIRIIANDFQCVYTLYMRYDSFSICWLYEIVWTLRMNSLFCKWLLHFWATTRKTNERNVFFSPELIESTKKEPHLTRTICMQKKDCMNLAGNQNFSGRNKEPVNLWIPIEIYMKTKLDDRNVECKLRGNHKRQSPKTVYYTHTHSIYEFYLCMCVFIRVLVCTSYIKWVD